MCKKIESLIKALVIDSFKIAGTSARQIELARADATPGHTAQTKTHQLTLAVRCFK